MKKEELIEAIQALEYVADDISREINNISLRIEYAPPLEKETLKKQLAILQEIEYAAMCIYLGDPQSEIEGLPSWNNSKEIRKYLKSKDIDYFKTVGETCTILYQECLKLIDEIYAHHFARVL